VVALAVGSKLLPVKECKKIFRGLCKQAFTKRFLAGLPGVRGIIRNSHHSIYKTEELETTLKDVFEQKPIFGGKESLGSPAQIKVGVTSTSNGLPYLHANYNRAQSKEGEHFYHSLLQIAKSISTDTRYVFLRGNNHKEELQIWEA
jgi:hypothetical protein